MAEEHLVAVDAGVINADERASIREALAEVSPCDDCPLRERCAAERLACDAYARFVEGRGWQRAKREPTRERYLQAMADRDDAPVTSTPAQIEAWHRIGRASAAAAVAAARAKWLGVAVKGRTVTDAYSTGRGVHVVLHCPRCGRDAHMKPAQLAHRPYACRCSMAPNADYARQRLHAAIEGVRAEFPIGSHVGEGKWEVEDVRREGRRKIELLVHHARTGKRKWVGASQARAGLRVKEPGWKRRYKRGYDLQPKEATP